jgi:fatty acid desaturase
MQGSVVDAGSGLATGSDFAKLSKIVVGRGLLKRRPGYYAVRLTAIGLLLVGGWVGFAVIGDSWWQLLVAAVLGVAFAQTALIAHDIAHRQVFGSRRASEIGGMVSGNLLIGMSYGWWMDKHTRHHANPNHEERDPDVAAGVLAWTPRQVRASRGVTRFIARRQAWLFFPLLTLEALNLRVSSLRALRAERPRLRHRRAEATLLLVHVVGYVAALALVLSPDRALLFTAVHQALFGLYLGVTFAPNHKGMPILTAADRPDFLRRQVLTSRNVRGGRLLDVAFGGLNHQIEHHLFPSMPTPNLRKARPLVRDYCAGLGIGYLESGLRDSYRYALGHLHDVGAPLRTSSAEVPRRGPDSHVQR